MRQLRDLGTLTTESSVRRYRIKYKKTATVEALQPEKIETPVGDKGTVEVDPDGASLKRVVVTTPLLDDGDWGPILEMFGLNPEHYEVVNDTVRMKSWWVARGSKENDTWEPLQLFSYDARFRRINKEMIPQAKVTEWAQSLLADAYVPANNGTTEEWKGAIPTTYAMLVADPQLGKKGTEEAVENWKQGVLSHLDALQRTQYNGTWVEGVHVAFMGDEHENVVNSYTNQPHTVELNRSQQLELDYDLSVWTIKKVAELGLPISVSSVISNHGLWTRNDTKDPVTTNNDNSSTYVRRQVKRLFDELEPFGGPRISWTIGETTPGVVVNLSGVPSYFSHGFIEKGKGGNTEAKVQNAIERQILGDTERLGNVPLWFMAHYHHFYTNEFQDRTLFGCPALEATKSSEWMADQYGVWSNAGMLGLLVGRHTPRCFSDVNVY